MGLGRIKVVDVDGGHERASTILTGEDEEHFGLVTSLERIGDEEKTIATIRIGYLIGVGRRIAKLLCEAVSADLLEIASSTYEARMGNTASLKMR